MATAESHTGQFRMVSGVYALVDPRSGRTMYVGQAIDIDHRYRQHLRPTGYDGNVEKRRWIMGLEAAGLKPRLVILARCEYPESDDVERQLIRTFKLNGQCEFNKAPGGKRDRSASKITNSHKDDWFQLGRKVKAARALLSELGQDAAAIAGPKATAEAIEVSQALRKFVAKMEARLIRAYPEWADISSVFYAGDE